MRYLGIDYGSKRVGIAISDESNGFALPHKVIPTTKHLVSEIAALAKEFNVTTIVIGESKNYAGLENNIMKAVHALKQKLEQTLQIAIEFEPEFMTSREAEHIQGANDMLDASAAALILKSYLDKKTP